MIIHPRFDLVFCMFLLSFTSPCHSSSLETSPETFPVVGHRPDPFVEAAPLILAVACQNGVVVLASHTFGVDEPCIYELPEKVHENDNKDTKYNEDNQEYCQIFDLPENFKGPFRIHSVDQYGAALICAGWRADCEVLVDHCRSLVHAECSRFGPPSSNDDNYHDMIASDLSTYLAQCAVSERARSLSCAALFVAPGSQMSNRIGRVWLVDSTGVYPVRGLCFGGGHTLLKSLDKSSSPQRRISDHVNQKLMQNNWARLNTSEALKKLVQLLAEKVYTDKSDNAGAELETEVNLTSLLRQDSRLEAVVIDSNSRKMVRTRILPAFTRERSVL